MERRLRILGVLFSLRSVELDILNVFVCIGMNAFQVVEIVYIKVDTISLEYFPIYG